MGAASVMGFEGDDDRIFAQINPGQFPITLPKSDVHIRHLLKRASFRISGYTIGPLWYAGELECGYTTS